MTLLDHIIKADQVGRAVGHFNISTLEMLTGIIKAASSLNLPVVIGLSEGERQFIGDHQAAALIDSWRQTDQLPIFLNADHTRDLAGIKSAARAGFDAVIFDGSELSLKDNIAATKEAVIAAKSIKPDIVVEGELGYIGRSSAIVSQVPTGAAVTSDLMVKPEEAEQFVAATGVDLLAPAVGNMHGKLSGGDNPDLDIDRIKTIRQASGIPLVLHGGSGIKSAQIKQAVSAGMALVHVSTELRLAYKEGLIKALADQPEELAPYRLLKPVVDDIAQVAIDSLKLFN